MIEQKAAWQLFAAWIIALIASLAVLFVGEVMGQAPCNLCWFQRTFMFPLAIVLGIANLQADTAVWRYALPLAIGGLLVAGFHSLLFAGAFPEHITPCSKGISCTSVDMLVAGGLPMPYLSLAAFGVIAALLFNTRSRTST